MDKGTLVNLQPLLSVLIQLAAVMLLSVGTVVTGWAGSWVAKHWGWKVTQAQVASFDDALQKLIGFGAAQANDVITAHGWDSFEVKSTVLGHAVAVAASRFPDALKGVGLDPSSADFRAKLLAALEARYATAMVPIAASPVTPPAPVAAPNVLEVAPAAHA